MLTERMKELLASLESALAGVHNSKMLLQQGHLEPSVKVEVNKLILDIKNTVQWLEGEVK